MVTYENRLKAFFATDVTIPWFKHGSITAGCGCGCDLERADFGGIGRGQLVRQLRVFLPCQSAAAAGDRRELSAVAFQCDHLPVSVAVCDRVSHGRCGVRGCLEGKPVQPAGVVNLMRGRAVTSTDVLFNRRLRPCSNHCRRTRDWVAFRVGLARDVAGVGYPLQRFDATAGRPAGHSRLAGLHLAPARPRRVG